jgi:beta-phosphoglucomutase-like phosphatase (HAD superfamily)
MGFNKHNNDLNLLNKICNDKKNLFKKIVKKYLTSDSVFYATSKLINEIKKMNLKLICGSISANAKTELDLLKLTNKFDFSYSPQCKKRDNLSINEKTKISPITAILNDLSLSSEECIGIDNTYGRIAEFNNLNIFSVGICSSNKNIEKIAKFSFDNPEDLDLKKILFAYYKTNGKLIS